MLLFIPTRTSWRRTARDLLTWPCAALTLNKRSGKANLDSSAAVMESCARAIRQHGSVCAPIWFGNKSDPLTPTAVLAAAAPIGSHGPT